MKLERISENKIKFSITVEELEQKGLFEQEEWKNSYMWHDLFEDMLEEVQWKFGIEAQMEITVEIESFDEREVCMILTLEADEDYSDWEDIHEEAPAGERHLLVFMEDIEDIISAVKRISDVHWWQQSNGNTGLYFHEGRYYLFIDDLSPEERSLLEAFLQEYGEISSMTKHVLLEYGRMLIERDADRELLRFF